MDSLFRLEMRRVSRSGGVKAQGFRAYLHGTVVSAAAYRRGAKGKLEADGQRRRFDYSKKRGVAYTETLAPRGVAEFALVSEWLWTEVERVEKRKDSLLAYEVLITLPRDIPLAVCLKHLRRWILAECVAKGMVADLAIHTYGTALDPGKKAEAKLIAEIRASGIPVYRLEDGDLLRRMPPDCHHAYELPNGKFLVYQPHAHVLLTTREIGPEGFGKKVKAWGQKAQLYRWRKTWEAAYNGLLAEAGRRQRVSAKARWKQEADATKLDGLLPDFDPISKSLNRALHLGGGIYAARDGRLEKQHYGDMPMSAFDWNETLRDLRHREAAAKKGRAAAVIQKEEIVDALSRIQSLTDLGVRFTPGADGSIRIEGAVESLTAADRQMLCRHGDLLVKVIAAAQPPKLDDELRLVMELVEQLLKEGIRFFRTPKGALGYEPEGAIPPETYRRFRGMHEAILTELDRREKAILWQEAERHLAEQKRQLVAASQDREALRRAVEEERRRRSDLERGTEAIITAADAGGPLPSAPDGSRILQRLRSTFEKVRAEALKEKLRAERLKKTLDWLRKSFVDFVDLMARRRPEEQPALEKAKAEVLNELSRIEQPVGPGNRSSTERFKAKPKAGQEQGRPGAEPGPISPTTRSRDYGRAPGPTGLGRPRDMGKDIQR
mgnify:CR=1 FL=1